MEDNPPFPVNDKVEHIHGVTVLFLALRPHPVGEAGKVYLLTVGRHREIKVRGVELLVHVLV
jgi:hypothetical protein